METEKKTKTQRNKTMFTIRQQGNEYMQQFVFLADEVILGYHNDLRVIQQSDI